ncbi:MAG TPA: polysaccharide biosynthesis C-terminal domain-containing protein [Chitinophagaceae bacterium]
MGQIRKQTIQSSFLTYIGFIIGAINTYFFARLFTTEQYGLTQVIISISQIIAPLAVFGMASYMYRFFPYYSANLTNEKNDLLTVAVIGCLAGNLIVFSGCIIFEPFVVRKFSEKSYLVVKYYYWSLVFSFFFAWFMILESYLGTLRKTVFPSFMKETVSRALVLILIGLYATRVIAFNTFVILFCGIYFVIVLILIGYLIISGQLHMPFKFSHVTRRFKKGIASYTGFMYGSIVIHSIASQISTIVLAGAKSLGDTGVFALNQYTAAILQVPYRSLQVISGVLIAVHWKNKNLVEIERIYKRSSINLLLICLFLFFNIWLNYDDGLRFLHLYDKFSGGKTVFLILSIYNILELGTGVNASLLVTSPAWRFEFYSGVVLLILSIPLNVFMGRWGGMMGVAYATLITFTIYNVVRLIFIHRRFNMWPFSRETLYALAMGTLLYFGISFLLGSTHGLTGIILRSLSFSGGFIAGIYYLHLTPDLPELVHAIKKKIIK